MTALEIIMKRGYCCHCDKSLKNDKYINMEKTDFNATWKFPVAGNILTGDDAGKAVAFLCDECWEKKCLPKKVVEFNNDTIIYHVISK